MTSSLVLVLAAYTAATPGQLPVRWGGELRFAMRSDPKTFDALVSSDQWSEMVVSLTNESLLKVNRRTRKMEPALAESWKVTDQGRRIVFELRKGVMFSDGSPFTASDVAFTLERLADPKINSPKGSALRPETGKVRIEVLSPTRLSVTFPEIVASLEAEFAKIPIQSKKSQDKATLGPFQVSQYKAGSQLVLSRNPNYWKAEGGRRLPYLDGMRIDIQQNPDIEAERFRRGELQLLESVDPALYDRLQKEMPGIAQDSGPSNDIEFIWFNQAPNAPIPAHKLAWFRSKKFRRAVSSAIRRDDIVRLAFQGRATVAAGLASPTNKTWFKQGLAPHSFDIEQARKLLRQEGFNWRGDKLVDAAGNLVEFSLVTSAGNKVRARIASLLQQDLAKLGIQLNIATFDMPSLIERIARTSNYEACLLGFVNMSEDPMGTMNVLLSAGPQHMWNPAQKTPATPWEQEIDKLMRAQASTVDQKKRRAAYERVQQILWEEAPVLFLAHRNTLTATSQNLRNVYPDSEYPRILWNAGLLAWGDR